METKGSMMEKNTEMAKRRCYEIKQNCRRLHKTLFPFAWSDCVRLSFSPRKVDMALYDPSLTAEVHCTEVHSVRD